MDDIMDDMRTFVSKNTSHFIKNVNKSEIEQLANQFYNFRHKKLHFCGIGKSGNIAQHVATILKSIGLNAFVLTVENITHGDLGCVGSQDIVYFLSKSGNTKELINIVDILDCEKTLVCCSADNKLCSKVESTFVVPFIGEGDINFNVIPMSSVVNTIIYFNMAVNLYVNKYKYQLTSYQKNHPAGNIGVLLQPIKNYVNCNIKTINNLNLSVQNCIKFLNDESLGVIVFTNETKLYGVITSKDILNLYKKGINLSEPINVHINTEPINITDEGQNIKSILPFIKQYNYFKHIPVVNADKQFIGLLDNKLLLDNL